MSEPAGMFGPLPTGHVNGNGAIPSGPAWRPIVPVPDEAPREIPRHRLGEPSAVWDYRDTAGHLLSRVCRWDRGDGGKMIMPLSYCEDDAGRQHWRWLHLPAPRPLYGLDHLAVLSNATVLVVEGEKTADAAARLFPDHVVVTSSGGANAAGKADWSPLAGRRVVIWPDNDEPGRRYAGDVARLVRVAGALSARIVAVPSEWPEASDLADPPPDGVTRETLLEMLKVAAEGSAFLSGPDMAIVHRAAAPAPTLDITAFGPLATWIEQAAESKSAPVDYVAMPLLGGVAGVVGAARWVSPWPGWREPAILWAMLVGPPSSAKSPAMDAIRDPLAAIERGAASTWPEIQRAHETSKVAAEARREEWELEARSAVKDGKQTPPKPAEADDPEAPQMPRVVITDATVEATASILAGNPRGLVLWRDECSAWIGNIAKYGDGDRAFWVEAYGGRSYSIDRKKHPEPLRLDHLAVSIVGGIQPDRLATLLMNGDDDGMAARFLLTWPESVKPKRPSHQPDGQLVTRALGKLRKLAFQTDNENGGMMPITLPIEPAALDVFQEWREQHFEDSQSASGLMASSLGKMPGQALRLSLVLELLWWAAGPEGAAEPKLVSARALGAALDLVEGYFKPMLTRVLGEAALPQVDRQTAALARAILSRRAERINARQVRRDWRLPGLREGSAVAAAIGGLEEAGWLMPVGGRDGASAGRQRSDYVIDPRVHGGQS